MAVKPTSAQQPPELSSVCRAITEHAPLPMATLEGASHIVRYVNPAFRRLMNKPLEQLVGKPFCELLPEKDQCVTLLDRVFRTGKPESYTERERAEPHPVFWSYTMWPVLADERFVGVMIQVTETARFHAETIAMNEALMLGSLRQHELTEAADSLNVQLQREITERKQAEEALREAGERLLEADHRKDEFLAMLAHELRNPLAPICHALQIVRLAGDNPKAVQAASEMMERQVGHLVRLVDELLDISRISRGTIELRRERIELTSAVSHAVEGARSLVQGMDHELTVTLPQQRVYLIADPTRFAQVVGNLLNNACKFTDKGGRISLTVEREGEQAVIRVRDTGIGIAADQLLRIFEMFVQVDTSMTRSVTGLGIGLTLVKNLVEMHGGTVDVHSDGIGHGSEFVARFPIWVETPQPPSPEPAVSEPMTMPARRILVVDDNRDSADSFATLLKLAGNETHIAYDGLEALDAAAAFRPDVILLDIGLPNMNGYDVARKIREQPWGKRMVLVAVTGWGQDADRQKSKDAGFNGHLVKPARYDALMQLLAVAAERVDG